MKIEKALNSVLYQFKTGDIPKRVAEAMFPIPDTPSCKWSILNRTLMFIAGTSDGRGFRQWKEANRFVKKGAKAFYIFVPHIKKVKEDGEKKDKLLGFLAKPIFRFEDTDGEPLDYMDIELPEIPLMSRALEWGISIKAIPGNFKYYGYYNSKRKEIALATPGELTFFHELSHCADEKIKGKLKPGQDPLQEIIAELSAQVLCQMVGKRSDMLGNSYQYIEMQAEKLKLNPYNACLRVLADTEKVLRLILE